MPVAPPCLDCGHRLSPDELAGGLCPNCLLRLALEEVDQVSSEQPTLDFQETATLAYGKGEESEELAFSPGRLLGDRYRVESLLGRGGMGEVWRAYDLKLRLEVALKSLHPKMFETEDALVAAGGLGLDPEGGSKVRIWNLETGDTRILDCRWSTSTA